MTWIKLSDGFAEHPKLVALSDPAFRAHVTALCYAGRYNTDGILPAQAVAHFGVTFDPGELVRAGVWVVVDGGWAIHDFLEFNPSRERVTARRSQDRRRKETPAVQPTDLFPTPCEHGEPRGAGRCALCRHEREDTA